MCIRDSLGPGLLESVYERCMAHELALRGLSVLTQVEIPLSYKDLELECGYRADLIVNDKVLVELKAVNKLLPVHEAQLLTYLRLTGIHVGLILNFNVHVLKKGIVRMVLWKTRGREASEPQCLGASW